MAQLSRSAYVRNLVHSPFIGPTAKGAQGRFDPFAVPSATGPYLREADGWSRRKVDLADRGLGRGKWGGERAYRGFLERDRSARQSRRSGASPKCCLPRERKSTSNRRWRKEVLPTRRQPQGESDVPPSAGAVHHKNSQNLK